MFNGLGGVLGGIASTLGNQASIRHRSGIGQQVMPNMPEIPQGLGGMMQGYGPTFGQFNVSDEEEKARMQQEDEAEKRRIQNLLEDQLLGGGPVGSDDPTALDDIMARQEQAKQYRQERKALDDGLAYGSISREEYDRRMQLLEEAYAKIKD